MSELVKEINISIVNKIHKDDLNELYNYESKLTKEYNCITQEYRTLFKRLSYEKKRIKQNIIDNCTHNYIRYSEYHNDRYFICDKCGNEKY